ncbi:SERTA domain-containing protein 3 [Marasmius tenuissimus]|uniref:SERTA domain-containing protein 3 n=1 Tax=Marasmius tenuissimus TaxID=585030 RepID=A0ABR2ZMK8_9AGAR
MANRSAPAFPSQFESQTSAQRSLGRLKRVLSPDTQLISELEDKLAKSEKEKNAQRDTVATLHEELGSLKEEEQTLKQKIREQDAELDRLMNADEAEGLHGKYMATKNRLENAVAELKWTQKELWKAKSELVELKSNVRAFPSCFRYQLIDIRCQRPIKAVKNACTQTERDVDPDTSEDDCAQTSGELPIPYAGVDIRSISDDKGSAKEGQDILVGDDKTSELPSARIEYRPDSEQVTSEDATDPMFKVVLTMRCRRSLLQSSDHTSTTEVPQPTSELTSSVDEAASVNKGTSPFIKSWLEPALEYLNNGNAPYNAVLIDWANTEDDKKASRQGLVNTPVHIKEWKKKSPVDQFSEASNPKYTNTFARDFPREIRIWWHKLQPTWRPKPVDNYLLPLTVIEGPWPYLDRWGQNGWLLLFVAMKWWWASIPNLEELEQEESRKEWSIVMEEMRLTFKNVSTGKI